MDRDVVLVTGIAGGLARLAARDLLTRGHDVVGVDYRRIPSDVEVPKQLRVFCANYNKTKIEDVFRQARPSLVLHLGRVGNLKERSGKRFDLNVIGSQKITALCLKYGVRRMVVLSTFHIYGADPLNHTPIYEDEPLRAGSDFPQIADAIQLDSQAVTAMFQYPQLQTVVLRPTNVVGPNICNAMSSLLREPRLPVLLGFDPMVQFVYESDLVEAIRAVAFSSPTGVFNVAGADGMPWSTAVRLAGAKSLPIPSSLASTLLRLAGMFSSAQPAYLVNFIKHPCVISDEPLRRTFGWSAQVPDAEAIRSTVAEVRGWV
ncbi:MAG: NAD-dependent epimerase/dehydratase family protein [Polyangiaceae bacterium]|jgi:UDP-glucose 4-epimerase|nr:NAD-dependent epimerase/dehydratase family protein [Polyangiaceae bacterium]